MLGGSCSVGLSRVVVAVRCGLAIPVRIIIMFRWK